MRRLLLLLPLACLPDVPDYGASEPAADGDPNPWAGDGGPWSAGTDGGPPPPDGEGEAEGGEDDDDGEPGSGFVNTDVGGVCGDQCDPFDEGGCGRANKCTAVVCEEGWNVPDANACRPILGDRQAGEPCTIENHRWSGYDDCGAGSFCFPDGEGLEGHCFDFCRGDAFEMTCPGSAHCTIACDGVLPACEPGCDPLTLDCPLPDQVCIPHPDDTGFYCKFDGSGDSGAHGAPCGASNSCDPGMMCISAGAVGNLSCEGASSCCASLCDLSDADFACPGADLGEACEPFYEPGATPPGYENVGVCAILHPP